MDITEPGGFRVERLFATGDCVPVSSAKTCREEVLFVLANTALDHFVKVFDGSAVSSPFS